MPWKQPQTLIVAAGLVVLALFDGGSSPLAYSLLSVISWGCVLVGFVWRLLPTSQVSRQGLLAAAALALLAVLAGVSAYWAADQGRAVDQAVRWSAYAGVFSLALFSGSDRAGRIRWLEGLAGGLGAVVVLALLSRIWPDPFPPPVNSGPLYGSAERLSYPLGYWNALGLLGAVAMISLSSLAAGATQLGSAMKATSAGIASIAFAVVAMTGSRGAVLSCLIGSSILIACSPQRRRQFSAVGTALLGGAILYLIADLLGLTVAGVDGLRLERVLFGVAAFFIFSLSALGWLALDDLVPRTRMARRSTIALLVAGLIAAIGVLVAVNPQARFERLTEPPRQMAITGTVEGGAESGNGRWQLWGSALDAFERKPVLGIGAGGFEEWWAETSTISLFARDAHSLPVGTLAELGVAGGCLLFVLLAALGWSAAIALRRQSDSAFAPALAMTAATALASLLDWSWTVPAAAVPGLVAGALLTGYVTTGDTRPRAYRLGLVVMPAAWIAIGFGALVVAGEIRLAQSRSAAASGDYALAASRAEDAHILEPWSGAPYLQSALVEESAGDGRAALRFLAKAESRDNQDWRLALIEYRIQAQLDNGAAARAARSRALLLYPRLLGSGNPAGK